jgi:hypothetical protein
VFAAVFLGLLLTSQFSFGYRGRSSLSPSDWRVNFGGLAVGSKTTKPEVLTNRGTYPVTISSASLSESGFELSGPSFPLTLNSGESVTLEVIFAPTSGSAYSGTLAVAWGRYGRALNIPVVGSGTGAGSISALPSNLTFGSVVVGSSLTKAASLTATGSSAVISSVTTTNSEFTISGLTLPLTLSAGQNISFTVKFAPKTSGTASASLAFTTNGAGSVASQTVSGTGAAPAPAAADHTVSLSWTDNTTATAYNVYRGAASGGPYAKVNASPDTGNAYTDDSVASGKTYFYVVTSLDDTGTESGYSKEVSAAVPN